MTFFGLPDREKNPLITKCGREQHNKGVGLYIKYKCCATDAIQEFGYPKSCVFAA